MEVTNQPRLSFQGVDIVNVSFNSISPPDESLNINLSCVPKVYFPVESKNRFNIVMDIKIVDEKYFELSLKAVGKFELSEDLTDELKKTFVNSNAPAIMFPYIRAFVTTFTSNLGKTIGTLWLPAQFFKGDLEEIH